MVAAVTVVTVAFGDLAALASADPSSFAVTAALAAARASSAVASPSIDEGSSIHDHSLPYLDHRNLRQVSHGSCLDSTS